LKLQVAASQLIEKGANISRSATRAGDYNICMRRLLSIAVLGAAALLLSPAQAQVRGGMMGGRGGGIAAPRGGGIAAPRMSPGFRSGPAMGVRTFAPPGRVFVGRPGVPSRGFIPGVSSRRFITSPRFAPSGRTIRSFSFGRLQHDIIFSNDCFFFPCFNGFFHHRHHFFFGNSFFFGNPFFFGGGFGFGSPFFGAPFLTASYIPGFDYPYNYPPPQPQPVAAEPTTSAADIELAREVQRLSDEIEDLREEQSRAREPRPPLTPGGSLSAMPAAVSTTFVFSDGRRITAQNYAIAGETLWIVNENVAKKYSLADLDRAATEQVNAANGVEVHLPPPKK
jgi:hypothetical protein